MGITGTLPGLTWPAEGDQSQPEFARRLAAVGRCCLSLAPGERPGFMNICKELVQLEREMRRRKQKEETQSGLHSSIDSSLMSTASTTANAHFRSVAEPDPAQRGGGGGASARGACC